MGGHQPQNGVQRADPQKCVIRHGDSLMSWDFCLEDDVASCLVNGPVIPVPAEAVHQFPSGKVSWQFQGLSEGEAFVFHQVQPHRLRC